MATPEGVTLEATLAGVGSRFVTGLLDQLLRSAILLALAAVVVRDHRLGAALPEPLTRLGTAAEAEADGAPWDDSAVSAEELATVLRRFPGRSHLPPLVPAPRRAALPAATLTGIPCRSAA